MSLNKFTDISVEKKWMNIYANEIKVNIFDAGTLITDSITIDRDEPAPVYITMKNEQLPPDNKTYGFRSSTATSSFNLTRFDDLGVAVQEYLVLTSGGQMTIPPATRLNVEGGLNMVNGDSLLNVPKSSATNSFYEEFTSSGNNWSGAYTTPQAVEYKITRVGDMVTINAGTVVSATTNLAQIVNSVLIPAQFRPSANLFIVLRTTSNTVSTVGMCEIQAGGLMVFFPDITGGNFASTGNGGFNGVTLTYTVV